MYDYLYDLDEKYKHNKFGGRRTNGCRKQTATKRWKWVPLANSEIKKVDLVNSGLISSKYILHAWDLILPCSESAHVLFIISWMLPTALGLMQFCQGKIATTLLLLQGLAKHILVIQTKTVHTIPILHKCNNKILSIKWEFFINSSVQFWVFIQNLIEQFLNKEPSS